MSRCRHGTLELGFLCGIEASPEVQGSARADKTSNRTLESAQFTSEDDQTHPTTTVSPKTRFHGHSSRRCWAVLLTFGCEDSHSLLTL